MLLKTFPDENRFLRLANTANVIPVCAEILADTVTPVTLLHQFLDGEAPMFLFESVEGGERWGRFSFMGISSRHRLSVYADHIAIDGYDGRETHTHNGKPLTVLRKLMDRYRPASIPELPGFWGGLVGHFNYEMMSFFETIPHQWPANKPLADFIIPDEMLIFDNVRHTVFIVAIAFTGDMPEAATKMESLFKHASQRVNKVMGAITRHRVTVDPVPDRGSPLHPRLASEQFCGKIQSVKKAIGQGEIIQAVISQPFVCDSPPDLWQLYRAQRYINPSPYMFFVRFDNTALVGSSPETMVRLENGEATLRPIAGTRPRGFTEQEDRQMADDLLADDKERAEHLMLVDLGRNDLGRVARTGTVQVTDLMVVERYSHVMHMVSNICCELDETHDAWDLFQAVFPAGTLSGAPKVRAMEIISETEETPRGPYGGAVGYISFQGNMDMAIIIRTAFLDGRCLTVQAGAGIVADSDPEAERIESVNKAMAIARALQLASGNDATNAINSSIDAHQPKGKPK